MSEGGEVRGSWNSDKHFDYVKDPQPAVDGGDGSASVGLTPEQEALCKAMLKRTQSDPQGDRPAPNSAPGSKTLHHQLSDVRMSPGCGRAILMMGVEYV